MPTTFQLFMNDIFRDILDQFMIIYLDDILFSENQELSCMYHSRLALLESLSAKLEKS